MKTAVGQMCEIGQTGTAWSACAPSLSTNFQYMEVQEKEFGTDGKQDLNKRN